MLLVIKNTRKMDQRVGNGSVPFAKRVGSVSAPFSQGVGILDPNGDKPNPLNGEPYSQRYKNHSKIWSQFATYGKAAEILEFLTSNAKRKLMFFISGTGTGKSALLPRFVLHANGYLQAKEYDKKIIGISEPKKSVVINTANYAAIINDVQIGKEIGCKFQNSDKSLLSKDSKMVFMTDGTLLNRLEKDPDQFVAIIIDEAHERKEKIDLIMASLKTLLNDPSREITVILISATIDVAKYVRYFTGADDVAGKKSKSASPNKQMFANTVIEVAPVTNFPIKVFFFEPEMSKATEQAKKKKGFEILDGLLKNKNPSKTESIIYFVGTKKETVEICQHVHGTDTDGKSNRGRRGNASKNKSKKKKGKKIEVLDSDDSGSDSQSDNSSDSETSKSSRSSSDSESDNTSDSDEEIPKSTCLELHSGTSEQFEKRSATTTSDVVAATNSGESGITIPALKYVIDSGFELISYFDPIRFAHCLSKQLITKAQALQRRGRVGRTGTGACYHLLTLKEFEQLKPYPTPEISRLDVTITILFLSKYFGEQTLKGAMTRIDKELMDPPAKPFLECSRIVYEMYSVVDGSGMFTSVRDAILILKNCEFNRALFCLLGFKLGVAKECCKIMAFIENMEILFLKSDIPRKKLWSKYIDKKSDHLTFLKICSEYSTKTTVEGKRAFCDKMRLSQFGMNKVMGDSYKYFSLILRNRQMLDEIELPVSKSKSVGGKVKFALRLSHRHLLGFRKDAKGKSDKSASSKSKKSKKNKKEKGYKYVWPAIVKDASDTLTKEMKEKGNRIHPSVDKNSTTEMSKDAAVWFVYDRLVSVNDGQRYEFKVVTLVKK